MSKIKKETIKKDSIKKLEDGSIVIQDEKLIKNMMSEGMKFSDDGSLDFEEGQDGISFGIVMSID